MSNKKHPRLLPHLCVIAFVCLFLVGCEKDAHRFERHYAAINRADEEYLWGKGDPFAALAREETAISDAERQFKNGYGHGAFVHCRVFLFFRRMKEASLRNDSEEVERLAKLLEKLTTDEGYSLEPTYGTKGKVDRQRVIQFITEWDNYLREDQMLEQAADDYILAKGDPQVALARIESLLSEAEPHYKEKSLHANIVSYRVNLILHKMKEAHLRHDSEELERQAGLLEKLVADEDYPLRPPVIVNGRLDRIEAIQYITTWDKSSLEVLTKIKAKQPAGK